MKKDIILVIMLDIWKYLLLSIMHNYLQAVCLFRVIYVVHSAINFSYAAAATFSKSFGLLKGWKHLLIVLELAVLQMYIHPSFVKLELELDPSASLAGKHFPLFEQGGSILHLPF